ncbi:amino acid ABC transporter ATP-binding protein [Halanaerobacter jeridensis]|uniref:Polar amino acid transport system ATP-binding protein n=1 Tax=Halanaerobacter jeridensis TaxID=706427 RepID=A0A938XSN0_9FIRM|nr:amino acid ABC transporter ATP-binding protein [Halanaerobacter jeridensis]MBM7556981.1 polar amino acid transport system ATP-binding protein [Halanaerobacter jeridensis]
MLKVINLTKSYDSRQVLRGITFDAQAGQTVVIMGPSGCGKSTTIRCLNRLTEPDGGKILLNGISVLELNTEQLLKLREKIAFVFQNFNLIEHLTVEENVMLPLIKSDLVRQEIVTRAQQVLEQVQLAERKNDYPANLSGGQKQRVGIARALIIEPNLLLLDEPTASLDPILVKEVLDVIEDLTKTQDQRIVIIVTHQVAFALKVADLILLLDQGQIVEQGHPEEIFSQPQSQLGQKYKQLLDYYRS